MFYCFLAHFGVFAPFMRIEVTCQRLWDKFSETRSGVGSRMVVIKT